jgi:hypothetical protein
MKLSKIEKVDEAIAKTKTVIAEQTAKLRGLERQRTTLEDAAIVAMFRKENMTDKDLASLLKLKSEQAPEPSGADEETPPGTDSSFSAAVTAREESEVRV